MKSFRFIFILLVISTRICAQDSISVSDKLRNNLSPVTGFSSTTKYNPSAKAYTLQTGLSDLSLGYEKQTGEAGLLETGTAFDDYAFRAESYTKKGKHHIWGSASYMRKSTDNVRWNESSDYFNIYPYVFADSVGGDNLKGEKYSFMGGYAQNLERISWGIQLDYWALMEYRSRDPRPNNNTSNLVFTGGLNYKLTDLYAVGGGFLLRKYKQNNKLNFYNVLGRPSMHHITGLGTDAYLFANDETACIFNGSGYGANLQFLPINGKGLSASFVYENFSFDKQLNNDQKLVLSSIDQDKFTSDISYLKETGTHTIGAKLEASYTDRKGTEGKFTRNNDGAFVSISSEMQYKNKITEAKLTLIYQLNTANASWYAMPYAYFSNTEESHKSSERKMEISKIDFGIKPGVLYSIKKHLLHIDGNIGYSNNLDSSLELTGLSPERSITQTLQANYDYLSSSGFIAGLSTRFDYALPQKNITVYIKGMWNYRKYDSVNSNLLGIQLGVAF